MTTTLEQQDAKQRTRLDWQREAACGNINAHAADQIFFVSRGRPSKTPAYRKFCDACPVKQECFFHAIVHHEKGVWGGATSDERALIPEDFVEYHQDRARREGWFEEGKMSKERQLTAVAQKRALDSIVENLDSFLASILPSDE